MHRGVQEFVRWVETKGRESGAKPNPPATASDLMMLEQQVGSRLPEDLRLVLSRFNGVNLPSGLLLGAGSAHGQTIDATLREYAQRTGASFLDYELLLPFHRTDEGNLLAFDRSAGPVPDTWPIVDFYADTGEVHLVHRTFDGWCRACVAEWTATDYTDEFSLEKYLRGAKRHALIEPDVATAHATVAHALRRAGQPDEALAAYLTAARCVPPLPRCDWEALKIAVLIGKRSEALEAASRLSARGPEERWHARETTPAWVADAIGRIAEKDPEPERAPWMRMLDLLVSQAEGEERTHVTAIRTAIHTGQPAPPPMPRDRESPVPPGEDAASWWVAARDAYSAGQLRDEDLLLDPQIAALRGSYDFGDLLRIRREF